MKCVVCMCDRRNMQSCSRCVSKWCSECHYRISTCFAQTMLANVDLMIGERNRALSPLCPVCRTPVTSHHSIDDQVLLGTLLGIRRFQDELSDEMLLNTRKYMHATSEIHTITEQIKHIQTLINSNDSQHDLVWNQCALESLVAQLQKETCTIRLEFPLMVEETTNLATDLMHSASIENGDVRCILNQWDRATSPIQFSTFLPERIRFLQRQIELTDMLHCMITYMQRRIEVQRYIGVIQSAQRLRNGLWRLCKKHKSCPNAPDTPNDMCRLLHAIDQLFL